MKFNNKKTGQFRSMLEAQVWKQRPRKKGIKYEYETHEISYSIERKYIPDIVLYLPSGKVIYIEVKGYFNREQKTKMAFVKYCNPDLDIRMVFGAKKKSDRSWCEKFRIPYAVGQIPKEWLVE